jgi:hypothetical protein
MDIVDYKEYNIVNYLFQLAILAKKELQGCQLMKSKNSFTPRPTCTTPSRTTMPSGAHSSTTHSASHVSSTLLMPSGAMSSTMESNKPSILQGAVVGKPSLSTISTGQTSDIKCHHCHDVGHFQRDCPSKKSYIATDDGGCVSASDNEVDFTLQTHKSLGASIQPSIAPKTMLCSGF